MYVVLFVLYVLLCMFLHIFVLLLIIVYYYLCFVIYYCVVMLAFFFLSEGCGGLLSPTLHALERLCATI